MNSINEIVKPKLIEQEGLTIVGLKGNQSNLTEHSEIIEKLLPEIKNIIIPFYCHVVWSINHELNLYEIFQGFVVSKIQSLHEELEVLKINHTKYLSFEHTGETDTLIKFLEYLHWEWLPKSTYKHNQNSFTQIQFTKSHKTEKDKLISHEKRTHNWEIWLPIN